MNSSDPQWFRMVRICRWPVALVASAWLLGSAVKGVVSNPISVKIEGGVSLNEMRAPIPVVAATPLPVSGSVKVANSEAIRVAPGDIMMGTPVTVDTHQAIAVEAISPIPVTASEAIAVTARDAIPVIAPEAIEVSSRKPVTAVVQVEAVKQPISLASEAPIAVQGTLGISRIDAPVRVNARGRIFPHR